MGLSAAAARHAADGLDRLLRARLLGPVWRRLFGPAVLAARTLQRLDRHTDTRIDVSRPGRALLAAVPDAVERLAAELGDCVVISATNGKTTTTNMLAEIVRAAGLEPVVNDLGANMPGGICAALLAPRGRAGAARVGVFEVDELWLEHLVGPLRPRVIALGNLSSDQLERTGGPDRVASRWSAMVADLAPTTVLVANGDDRRISEIAEAHPRVVRVGSAEVTRDPDEVEVEVRDVVGRGLDGAEAVFVIRQDQATSTQLRISIGAPGRFNVANAALAAGAAVALGLDTDAIPAGLAGSGRVFGRMEVIAVRGRRVTLMTAKNPVGLEELAVLLAASARRAAAGLDLLVLLAQNLDGSDVSWLRDARLDVLAPHVASATCGGALGAAAAAALHDAGVPAARVTCVDPDLGVGEALDRAIDRASGRSAGEVVVISNYAAMLDLRETLAELGHAPRYWQPARSAAARPRR